MALTVLFSSPQSNDISIPIDSNLELVFSKPIDIFTVQNGISLYSIGAQTWTGALLSSKDSLTSDVKSDAGSINVIEFSATISGSTVTIIPLTPLGTYLQYYLQVAPGNDPTRFISTQTTDAPSYSANAVGQVRILSAYTGKISGIYSLLFTSGTTFDLLLDNIFQDSYTFTYDTELLIDNVLTISISNNFIDGDISTINVYTAEGLDSICKVTFTTSQYTVSTPTSIKIEDKLYNNIVNEFKVVSSIPAAMSINHPTIIPIVIKFNRPPNSVQDLTEKIKIHKLNMETGEIKRVKFLIEILGSTVKIYLHSVMQYTEISDLSIYNLNIDKYSKLETYKYIV